MGPFCYAVVTLVLAVLRVQGEIIGGLLGTYGHYDSITIDTRRNPIFSPAQDEAVPLTGSYYVRLNETTQNNITFKLCEENGAMEDNDFDLKADPGYFHPISFGLYEWIHNFDFATDNGAYVFQYVLLVDDGSGIYGISGHFSWVHVSVTATTTIKATTIAGTATVTATADTSTSTISNPPTKSTTSTSVPTTDATSSPSPSLTASTPSASLTSDVSPSPTTSPTEGSSPSSSPSVAVILQGPSSSGSSGPSSAAVIGGAVGGALGVVILALVAAMLVILRRRRARKTNEAYTPPDDYHGKPELDNISSPRAELDSPRSPKELDTFYAPTELPSPQPDSDTKAIAGRGKTASPTLDGVAGLGHDHNGTPRPERSSSDEGPYELPGLG